VILDHVEEPLPGVPPDRGRALDEREIVREGPLPIERGEPLGSHALSDEVEDLFVRVVHGWTDMAERTSSSGTGSRIARDRALSDSFDPIAHPT
jgi:hypothetical protein